MSVIPQRGHRLWLAAQLRLAVVFKQPARALALLDRALARWPGWPWALAARSLIHHQQGDGPAALADAQTLVALHPQRSAADWFNLGYLLDAQGQWEPATQAFAHAVALQPGLDTAWYGLGLAFLRLGRVEDALQPLQRCTELQPLSPFAWYQLAHALAELGRGDQAQAIVERLSGFEPGVAQRLRQELGAACVASSQPARLDGTGGPAALCGAS